MVDINTNPSEDPTTNGWGRWAIFVLKELERLNDNQEKMGKDIATLRSDIAVLTTNIATLKTELKLKSGVWGALGGLIPVCVAVGLWIIQQLISR